MGFEVIGTGHYVPGEPVTNAALARVMDTSDEWIFQRSGIRQRHFAAAVVDKGEAGGLGSHRNLCAHTPSFRRFHRFNLSLA